MSKEIRVGIVMGSDSDLPIMKAASEILKEFNIRHELRILSAHRAPDQTLNYSKSAIERGLEVIIAGAGGAAHLPGVCASVTVLPVIGVPIKSVNSLDGWDSILSILQMPPGVPVATVGLNAAKNAGILAIQILAIKDDALRKALQEYKISMKDAVLLKDSELSA